MHHRVESGRERRSGRDAHFWPSHVELGLSLADLVQDSVSNISSTQRDARIWIRDEHCLRNPNAIHSLHEVRRHPSNPR